MAAHTDKSKPWDHPSQVNLFLDLSEVKLALKGSSLKEAMERLSSTSANFHKAHVQSYGPNALAIGAETNWGMSLVEMSDNTLKSKQLLQALQRFPLSELELHIHGWPLPPTELTELIATTKLRTLTLSAGVMAFGGSIADAFRGHPSLVSLELEGLRGLTDWNRILRNLTHTCLQLRQVRIQFPDSADVEEALTELCASKRLTQLRLKNVPFLTTDAFYALWEALADNTTLTDFALHPSNEWVIEGGGIEAIGEALEENTTLQTLLVGVEDCKALPIIQSLETNRTLQRLELRLGQRRLSPSYLDAIEKMLKENYVLEHLEKCGRNCISYDQDIDLYLRLNQLGRYHLVESGNATRNDWLKVIVDQKDDTRIVQYLLSKNPSLCIVPLETVEARPKKRQKLA